ncbi:hypothetical protein [Nonomuraea sp. NPDC048916]|uniref:hypothetical protein n=1 Tax=Nonomuraea sp. NPDC048916 TaxID=3154232 RepID=UPI0033D2CB59
MGVTEQDLRELLERDSQDGPHRGVTVADVDGRVRRIRRHRGRAAGSAVVMALAVVTAVGLQPGQPGQQGQVGQAGSSPQDVWTGVLARPTPTVVIGGLDTVVTGTYERGGTRERLTFWTGVDRIGFRVTCGPDDYALVWLNGDLVANGRCTSGPEPSALLAGAFPTRDGENEVVSVVIPAASAGNDMAAEEWAGGVVARTEPYPADWSIQVVQTLSAGCEQKEVVVDPGSGQAPHWICPLD